MKYLLTAGLLLLCCVPEAPGTVIDRMLADKFDEIKGILKYLFFPELKVKDILFKNLNFKNLHNIVLSSDIPLNLKINSLNFSLDFMDLEGHYHLENITQLPGNVSVFGGGKLKVHLEGINFMLTGKLQRCAGYGPDCGARYCLKMMTMDDICALNITSATLNLVSPLSEGLSFTKPNIAEIFGQELRNAFVPWVNSIMVEFPLSPPNDHCPTKPEITQLSEETLLHLPENIEQLFGDLFEDFYL